MPITGHSPITMPMFMPKWKNQYGDHAIGVDTLKTVRCLSAMWISLSISESE